MKEALSILQSLLTLGNSAGGKAALHRLLGMDKPTVNDVRNALASLPPIQPPKES